MKIQVARVLVIQAHPDDEAFAAGAAIPTLASQGAEVVLLVATGGEAGELGANPTLSMEAARTQRADRLTKSSEILGITRWGWLGAEGQWVDTGGRPHPNALSTADLDELTTHILAAISAFEPDLILTVGEDGLTGHPDHIVIHKAVIQAITKLDKIAPRVLGARLHAQDVERAQAFLSPLNEGKPVGSGRVSGAPSGTLLIPIGGNTAAVQAKKSALDSYVDGLGSAPLAEFMHTHTGRGDSLLLRGVFESSNWGADYYQEY